MDGRSQPGDGSKHAGSERDLAGHFAGSQVLLFRIQKPIVIIDPHLSWYDELRFYEERVYAGDFATSGVAILGIPFLTLSQPVLLNRHDHWRPRHR